MIAVCPPSTTPRDSTRGSSEGSTASPLLKIDPLPRPHATLGSKKAHERWQASHRAALQLSATRQSVEGMARRSNQSL